MKQQKDYKMKFILLKLKRLDIEPQIDFLHEFH